MVCVCRVDMCVRNDRAKIRILPGVFSGSFPPGRGEKNGDGAYSIGVGWGIFGLVIGMELMNGCIIHASLGSFGICCVWHGRVLG
jgi:hypothetical protein